MTRLGGRPRIYGMKTLGSIGETRALLPNVSWSTYEALLEDMGPHTGRLAYEEGLLEIMSPSGAHELMKGVIRSLIEAYAAEFGMKFTPRGSLTLKRQLLDRGAEPDECYYFQKGVRKDEIDLAVDPPPDLVLEIEITKSALNKLGIYAAFGVPELWRFDGERLRIHVLEPEGSYVEAPGASCLEPGAPGFSRFGAREVRVAEAGEGRVRARGRVQGPRALPPRGGQGGRTQSPALIRPHGSHRSTRDRFRLMPPRSSSTLPSKM